jgi:hypothetical protein
MLAADKIGYLTLELPDILNLRLPKVEPFEIHPPTHCPLRDRRHPKKNVQASILNRISCIAANRCATPSIPK